LTGLRKSAARQRREHRDHQNDGAGATEAHFGAGAEVPPPFAFAVEVARFAALKTNLPSSDSMLMADCVAVIAWPGFNMVSEPPGEIER
jgi:hypothetical protein